MNNDRYIVVNCDPWYRVHDQVGGRLVGGHFSHYDGARSLADRLNGVQRDLLAGPAPREQGHAKTPENFDPAENTIGTVDDVLAALQAQDLEVLKGKGGFWIKGEGHITLAQARTRTGIKAPARPRRERTPAWGDYAVIAAMNDFKEI